MTPAGSQRCGILVVDDDAELAATLREFLQQQGYRVAVALSAAEAIALKEQDPCLSIALVDLIMPLTDGITLMEQLHRMNPDLPVVIMTGYGTIETAVGAIKRGAEDYLTKPFDREMIRKKVARLMEVFELRDRVSQLEAKLKEIPSLENLVHVSPPMQKVVERARAAANTDAAVLLVGETGTGKEMLARAIHATSRRAQGPFAPVNCGALPRDLVESELFGYKRGAFTGAYADTRGIFATAAGGTVFLDEIGEVPKEVQVKLLRVLQEGELRPLGSSKPVQVDVRVVSATNRPLTELRGDRLREDFYFRVATVVIEVPPLRSRPEDVLVLAQHFVSQMAERYEREVNLARSALELLLSYSFPGNVRELQNLLESAIAVSTQDPQTISDKDLKHLLQATDTAKSDHSAQQPLSMDGVEHLAVQQALRLSHGNRTKAASVLGISRDTLYRKMRQWNML